MAHLEIGSGLRFVSRYGSPQETMSLSIFIGDPLAGPVLSAIEKEKWRVARDRAKDLCKKDRSRYLMLLVEANIGLTRDLISRGLHSDARTVLDYLKTIASAEVVAALEKELTSAPAALGGRAGAVEPGGHSGFAIIRLWPELLRIDSAAESGQELSSSDISTIDDVVTAFSTPPAIPGDERSDRVALELGSVLTACQATSEGRWDDAAAALRQLPGRSIFRHWRLFLRGVRLFMQGDEPGGRECFDRLPPGGACGLAAASMQGGSAGNVLRPSARAAWDLAVSGQPIEWAADMAAADASWHKGEWAAAKDLLSKGLGDSFPSRGHGLPAALTEALFFVGPTSDAIANKRYRQLLALWQKLCRLEKPPKAWMAACMRYLLISEEQDGPPAQLAGEVGNLLCLESELHGGNACRDSQGWQWLGEKLIQESPEAFFSMRRNHIPVRDLAGAIRAFESAKKSDPDNEAAWLGLLAAYETKKSTSNRNRLLDEMVSRFPKSKHVLLRAGALAVERGAFAKGIGYLELAIKIDPLDPFVRTQMLIALVQRVRDAHRKGREVAGIWTQIEPHLDASPSCGDLMRAKWAMRVRRSLLDLPNALAARTEAEKLAPSSQELLVFECLLSGCYGLELREDWQQAWAGSPPTTWAAISGIVHMISLAAKIPEFEKHASRRAGGILIEVLNFAARENLFVSDPSGALKVYRLLEQAEEAQNISLRNMMDDAQERMFEIIQRLPGKVVQANLSLRLLDLALREVYDSKLSEPKARKLLQSFIADAEKAGAADLADAGRNLLVEYEDGWDAPDFEIDGDDDDFDLPPDFSPKGALPRMVSDYFAASDSYDIQRMEEIEKEMAKIGMAPPIGARPKKPAKKAAKAAKKPQPKPPSPRPAGTMQQEFGFSSTP